MHNAMEEKEPLTPKCYSTVQHGGGGIMVWGCFAPSGPGRLVVIEGTMNSKMYENILQDNVRAIRHFGTRCRYNTSEGLINNLHDEKCRQQQERPAWGESVAPVGAGNGDLSCLFSVLNFSILDLAPSWRSAAT